MSVMHITKENFEQEVLRADKPVLLDFWATWCGPCRMVAPVVEAIAAEHPEVKVCKVDVDQENELAAQFRIVSIPTLIVMRNGRVAAKTVGYSPKEELLKALGL